MNLEAEELKKEISSRGVNYINIYVYICIMRESEREIPRVEVLNLEAEEGDVESRGRARETQRWHIGTLDGEGSDGKHL